MSAFFVSIRDYFKSEYNGRYFSLILRELAQHEPLSFCLLINEIAATSNPTFWKEISKGVLNGELSVECERSFQGASKNRRADLAIVRGETIIVLMEVKEFDHLNPENPYQLADYLKVVSNKLGFIHVHRFLPSAKEHRKILRKTENSLPVATLSYDQIHKALKDSKDEDRALGALVCHYLEDIGVGVYQQIQKRDGKALAFLMAQMLGFPSQTGMGKLQSESTVRRGPQLVTALLGDMEVLGEWLRRPNECIMPTRCSNRFWIEPWLNHKKLRRDIRKTGDVIDSLPAEFTPYVGGGQVYFVAHGSLRDRRMKGNDFLHVELGLGLELEKGVSSVRFFVYTRFISNKFDTYDTYVESGYFKKFPKENVAFRDFRSCLLLSKAKALKITTGPNKSLLKDFIIPNAN